MHTQDNRIGAPEGVPTQEFVRRAYINHDFTAPGIANRPLTSQGFSTEDILWALGIWSVIICLSPVIVFYMLMVA